MNSELSIMDSEPSLMNFLNWRVKLTQGGKQLSITDSELSALNSELSIIDRELSTLNSELSIIDSKLSTPKSKLLTTDHVTQLQNKLHTK